MSVDLCYASSRILWKKNLNNSCQEPIEMWLIETHPLKTEQKQDLIKRCRENSEGTVHVLRVGSLLVLWFPPADMHINLETMVVCLCVTPWWTGDLSRAQLRLHPNLQQLGKGSDLLLLKHCGIRNEWKENMMCLKQRKHHLKGEERLCYENDMNMGFIF